MNAQSKGLGGSQRAGRLEIHGRLLTRNTLLNLLGQGLPILVVVATVPFVLRGLGIERFGILALVGILLSYLNILDLGLSRALTKFAAEGLGRSNHDVAPSLVWTTVVAQTTLGILGGLLLVAATPLLVESVLRVPPGLAGEATTTLYLLAAFIPPMLVSTSFRGLLEAGQRFDLVNAVVIPSNTALYLVPALGVWLGFGLPGMIGLLLATKLLFAILLLGLTLHVLPGLKQSFSIRLSLLPPLVQFGGWITVSNVIGPITRYLDRFLIASLHTLGGVTYYALPFDVVERFWIVPACLVMTLFPAFSTLAATQRERLEVIYLRAVKYLLVGMGPVLLLTVRYAEPILRGWLGSDIALHSTPTFRILVLTAVIGLLAPVPGTLLQGVGRPDILAWVYLAFLLPNAAVLWLLVKWWGIVGAAITFACRSVIETGLLFYFASRVAGCSFSLASDKGIRNSLVVLAGFGALLSCIALVGESVYLQAGLTLVAVCLWAIATWTWVLDGVEKAAIAAGVSRVARLSPR